MRGRVADREVMVWCGGVWWDEVRIGLCWVGLRCVGTGEDIVKGILNIVRSRY